MCSHFTNLILRLETTNACMQKCPVSQVDNDGEETHVSRDGLTFDEFGVFKIDGATSRCRLRKPGENSYFCG